MAERSFTVDQSTQASTPGQLRISRIRWFMRYPKWPILLGVGIALGVWAALMLHWSLWLVVAILGAWKILYWTRVREHFVVGDANPGVVISSAPILIAVRTDLTKGLGSYPVIKVFGAKPSARWTTPLQVGERVATVALYSEHLDGERPYWKDFDPIPVEPLVVDPEDARRLLARFSEDRGSHWSEASGSFALTRLVFTELIRMDRTGPRG